MKGSDRLVVLGVGVVAVLAIFWFMAIAPKRDTISELDEEIATLQEEVSQSRSTIASAEQARATYPAAYANLVKLGKAVPEDSSESALIIEMDELGRQNGLDLNSLVLAQGIGNAEAALSGAAPVAAPPPTTPTPNAADASEQRVEDSIAAEGAGASPAVATEAAAALEPLGSTIGPAEFRVMPFNFEYSGNYFDVASFFGGVDDLVSTTNDEPKVSGRLVTIDSFTLEPQPSDQDLGRVLTKFSATTYILPPSQGLTFSAQQAGPAPDTLAPTIVSADPEDPAASTDAAVAP